MGQPHFEVGPSSLYNEAEEDFRQAVWDYYHDHARSMPWREVPTPYDVVVSEFLLQQTRAWRAGK